MRIASSAPVLVFDLDGTILRCNSFPLWVLFLLVGRITGLGLRRRVTLSVRTLLLLFARKVFRLSHDELQRRLQDACASVRLADMDQFVVTLSRHVRPNLRSLLSIVAERRFDAVLATAAAADYAEPLAKVLGFRHVLATSRGRSRGERANAGSVKRQRVAEFLHEAGWSGRPVILFTDHLDDLPLMRESVVVCWFGSIDMLRMARAIASQAEFIHCGKISGEELQARILPLCDHAARREEADPRSLSEMTLS